MSATLVVAIVLVVALVGVVALMTSSFRRAPSRAWFDVASRYGLHFQSSDTPAGEMLQLEGRLEGVAVEVATQASADGGQIVATVARARFERALPEGLELLHEGLLEKRGEPRGAQDLEVGLPDADGVFIVRGRDPEVGRQLVQVDRVRHALLALHAAHREAHIADGEVVVRLPGLIDGPALEGCLRRLVDLVEAVDAAAAVDVAAADDA